MRRVVSTWAFALVAGCSGGYGKGEDALFESGWLDSGGVADTGTPPEDRLDPAWWELGGAITIEGGAPDAAYSTLALTLLGSDGLVLCEDSVAVSAIEDVARLPDLNVYTWWEVSHGDPQGPCAAWEAPVPSPLLLGVGALHADIRASLDPLDLAEVADNLNGAYASLDEGATVYVFGVAGTDAAYVGEAEAALEAPLADGVWLVRAVYPFSY